MCTCTAHGTCSDGVCICQPRWLGDDCQYSTEVETRLPVFMAYRIIFALIFVAVAVYVAWQLGRVLRSHHQEVAAGGGGNTGGGGGGRTRSTFRLVLISSRLKCGCPFPPTPPVFCLSGLLIASILRAIWYAVDPHSWRGVFLWQADGLWMNVPIMLILVTFCINLIVWMRMQIRFATYSSGFSIRFVSSQPAVLKAIVVSFPIIVFFEATMYATGVLSYGVTAWIYNIATAITILYVITCGMYFGGKIMSYLKHTTLNTGSKVYSKGLINMTKMVVGVSIWAAIAIIALLIQAIVYCGSLRLGYCEIVYHTIFRVAELGIITLVVSAVTGKVASDREKSGFRSQESGTGKRQTNHPRDSSLQKSRNHHPSSKSHRSHKSQISEDGEKWQMDRKEEVVGIELMSVSNTEDQQKEKEKEKENINIDTNNALPQVDAAVVI